MAQRCKVSDSSHSHWTGDRMTAKPLAILVWVFLVLEATLAVAQPATSPPTMSTVYANSWALVIGVSDYQKVSRLNFASSDAREVAAQLKRLGFPAENIRVLVDRDATLAGIFGVLYRAFTN